MFLWQIRKYEQETRNKRKENTRMVIIYLTQRTQRTQSFNFPAVHADEGVVVSFTTTRERRGRVGLKMTSCIRLIDVSPCQPLRPLVARSQRPLWRKCCLINSLRPLRPLRAERKHPCGDYISHAKDAEDTKA